MNLDADTWVKLYESCGLSIKREEAKDLAALQGFAEVQAHPAARSWVSHITWGATCHIEFVALCDAVKMVDADAAYWMRNWLPTWAAYNNCAFRPDAEKLGLAFWWRGTPQGRDYWLSIARRLDAKRQEPSQDTPAAETPPGPYYDELRAKRSARDLAINLRQEVRSMLHSGGWHDDD